MAKQNEKILIADSDPEVLDLAAQQVLAPQGFQVATATDGPSALQKALRLAPDILITALDLPGLSGRDLLTALNAQGFQSLVIATGPKGSDVAALQALRLGAKDYLTKPLREAELLASVERALQELRLRREREQLAQKLQAANQQLERRVKELTTLYSIGQAVTATTDLNQLFARLMDGALFVTQGELGWLSLVDETSGKLVLRAGKNLPAHGTMRVNQPWDDGLSSLLMLSGEGITIAGEPLAKMRAGLVARAAVAVPIKIKGDVIGAIVVGNRSGRPFTERDQAMLSAVGDYASITIANARLVQTVEARVQSLERSQEGLVREGHARDAMVLRIGRELKLPLEQARASLDDLARGSAGPLAEAQAAGLRGAVQQLDQAQRRVDEMALAGELGRIPNRRATDLGELARQSMARLSPEAQAAGVALVAELPAEPLKAAADAAQISRVLDALLSNAIKFSPRGGQVVARVRDSGAGMVETAVRDHGAGIPPEVLPHIWEKFYQGDEAVTRRHGGAGLGLTVVKQVVEAHGGQAWVETEPGQGSTFYFSLIKV